MEACATYPAIAYLRPVCGDPDVNKQYCMCLAKLTGAKRIINAHAKFDVKITLVDRPLQKNTQGEDYLSTNP